MKRKAFFLSLGYLICILHLYGQDSMLNALNDSMAVNSKTAYVSGTFKALYVVNMKTIEAPAAGALNVEIQHRFGSINSGSYALWGLDNATLRIGFDYGISNRLSVGVGRSSYQKTFDGYLKYVLFRQTEHNLRMPVSVSLLTSMSYYTQHLQGKDSSMSNVYRINYTTQILIARKFSSRFSMELTPTLIHYNQVPTTADQNNVFAIAGGARMKITKRMAFTMEYDYLFRNQVVSVPVNNSLSFGWDIETGGHVFQLVFSNSQSMIESQYIGQTPGTWGNGDIYFGFNLSRIFNLKRK